MAIDLKRVTRGPLARPPRVLIYGFDGVGKTSFAAGAPDPFFIDANRGSTKFDVARVLVDSWEETREWLTAIERGEVKCGSVVLDSITDLESLSHERLFPNSTVDKYEGGYGKGDTVVVGEWRQVIAQLERIWHTGKTIVIVAHAMVKSFSDPSGPSFDRFEVAARPKLAGLLRQSAEYVLFAREEVVLPVKGKNEPTRASTTGTRYIYTRRVPAYDAKARGTLLFPERLLLSWKDFDEAVRADTTRTGRATELEREIESMLDEIGDDQLSKQVRGYVKEYPTMINEAHNRVAARLSQKRNEGQAAGQAPGEGK